MKEDLVYITERFLAMLEEAKDYKLFWPPPSHEKVLPGSIYSERLPMWTVASGFPPVRGNRSDLTQRTKAESSRLKLSMWK